jgi:hypothetical protein
VKYPHSSVIIAALVLGNYHSARAQGEITFLAPQPLKASLDKLIPGFESKTGLQGENDSRHRSRNQAAGRARRAF